jgi:acyl-CoA dehydrogenase
MDMLLIGTVIAILNLGFFGAPFFVWAAVAVGFEFLAGASGTLLFFTGLVSLIFIVQPLRAQIISRGLMAIFKKIKIIPEISETEKQAIEAGTAWVEKDFFSGVPDLKTILSQPVPTLTLEEESFLNHQVETLCQMVDDWKLWKERDLSANAWAYIRKEKFLGMIIPKEYGGLGFSAVAHSAVVKKLASRSFVAGIYVMVPNSLGPAELLNHYGTKEQKDYYLPRLASGEDVPCFALTEVTAGSDAGNVSATGVLFKNNGVLSIRINWEKRYTSLAKISTLMGMAFHLKDPESLLGGKEDLGITCALVPTATPGITIDKRHDPLGVPFYNCPSTGKDVVVEADSIVGGIGNAGKGWMMLMECLAAGRGISFPAAMAGSTQLATRYVVPYSQVREQFGVSLAKFEGIQKPLSEIVSFTYMLEALRTYTLSALSQGLKPAVIASIAKYYSTEYSRKIMNHAMDILGGAGISMGPKNKIAPFYIAAPISITVEGANILTRCLMIFGQGAFRAHPFAFPMIDGLQKNDVALFDRSFFGLIGHGVQAFTRSVLLSLTRGWLAHPLSFRKQSTYYRRISWASATFALYTDIAMGSLGGKLKTKENLTGRFADVVSYLYLASAVLRKYESEGEKTEDWATVSYTLNYLFREIETAFQGIYGNFPVPVLGTFLRGPMLLWSKLNPLADPVSDQNVTDLMNSLHANPEIISRMTAGTFSSADPKDHLNLLEGAAVTFRKVEPILREEKKSRTHGPLNWQPSPEQLALLNQWRALKLQIVAVDEFNESEYHHWGVAPPSPDQASLMNSGLTLAMSQKKTIETRLANSKIEK